MERHLEERAVHVEAHGIRIRNVEPHVLEHLKRQRLTDERRIAILRDERHLAEPIDLRARKRIRAGERLALDEADTVALFPEPGSGVAAQVDPDVVVIEAGLAVVDLHARAIRHRAGDRVVLLVHVRLRRRVREDVERLQVL